MPIKETIESLTGLKISRSGKCCCPFHDEKTPSFMVYDDHYYCFGCGAFGDVVNFVADYKHIKKIDAVIDLGMEKYIEGDIRSFTEEQINEINNATDEAHDFIKTEVPEKLIEFHNFIEEGNVEEAEKLRLELVDKAVRLDVSQWFDDYTEKFLERIEGAKDNGKTVVTIDPFNEIELRIVSGDISTPGELSEEFDKLKTVYGKKLGNRKAINDKFNSLCRIVQQRAGQDGGTFDFDGIVLKTGNYVVDFSGVYVNGGKHICNVPVAPVSKVVDINSGEVLAQVKYFSHMKKAWETKTIPKQTLLDNRQVMSLTKTEINLTSTNAKEIVSYFEEILNLNEETIPIKKGIDHLGFYGDEFVPYSEKVELDIENDVTQCETIARAVYPQGDYTEWVNKVGEARKKHLCTMFALAASFASVIVGRVEGQCFVTHLYGGGESSGTGKTLSLQIAASVWGKGDEYWRTCRFTQFSIEKIAGALYNLPLMLDETQLIVKEKQDLNIYALTEGKGKARGNKYGSLQKSNSWHSAIITTGEQPLTKDNSGGGEFNRIIEVECKPEEYTSDEASDLFPFTAENFGAVGKIFVENLPSKAELRKLHAEATKEICSTKKHITTKQALAGAYLLVADRLADDIIFHSHLTLDPIDISRLLKTTQEVSIGVRAYEFLMSWVAINQFNFKSFKDMNYGEIYGKIDSEVYINGKPKTVVYILANKFKETLIKNGFDPRTVTREFDSLGVILKDKDGKYSKNVRFDFGVAKAYRILMDEEVGDEEDNFDLSDYDDLL